MENYTTESSNRKCGRILLAEDYEVNQKIARLMLQKSGFHVDVVVNGQQAVAAYKKNRYDLILMDIQMPVMDGYEATQRIRSWEDQMREKIAKNSDSNSAFHLPHADFKRIPIIAMTGDASMSSFDPKRYPGMDGCVSKPLQRNQLLSVIDRCIEGGSSEAWDPEPINEIDAPAENPAETNLPLDLDRAIKEFMGKEKILYAVLDQFMHRAGDQIDGLRQAGRRSDWTAVASEAHRIKGGAANLTAGRLSRVAADLEKAAKGKKTEKICELIEKLAAEFHHLKIFLRQKGL
jgi:CheY-like chemotaxis protein/HPt (histidine-containing phosphotransfer) domain-containing protein